LNRRERFRLGARRVSNAGRTSPVPACRKPAGGFARTPEGAFAGGHWSRHRVRSRRAEALFGCMFHDLPVGWSAKESNLQDIASPGLQPSCRPAAHTPLRVFCAGPRPGSLRLSNHHTGTFAKTRAQCRAIQWDRVLVFEYLRLNDGNNFI
jgi:hypothetical protein